jgi:ATP-dependent Zn protease
MVGFVSQLLHVMRKPSRAIAAHHEAGHAVIAHQLGYKVRRIEINDDGGRTVFTLGRQRLGRDEHAILINLAGPYAQKRFAPSSHWRSRSHTGFNSGYDFDNVTSLIYAMHGKGKVISKGKVINKGTVAEAYRRYVEAKAKAKELVKQHWQKIAAVAAYLFKHSVFTGDIRALYSQPRPSI